MNPPIAGIYPILDAATLARVAIDPVAMAQSFHHLAIGCVQLRCKESLDTYLRFAVPWMVTFRRHAPQVKIIINDHLTVATTLDADGIHVGQEDQAVSLCRATLGRDKWIGVSTHSVAEIQRAQEEGADYVGFGPIFPTQSKADAHTVQGLDRLAKACASSRLPVVAIGGIELSRLGEVARHGAAAAAMISTLLHPAWQDALHQGCQIWRQARQNTLHPDG
ncbi:MAG: thiamine phosphate synthase [Magnetococcales bacterium]|nr:thiamine phosphate synthase [Magnetococcales bacterium]NGZ27666.1 thiamine phosphate synthase [Magnetococcales bacterium]